MLPVNGWSIKYDERHATIINISISFIPQGPYSFFSILSYRILSYLDLPFVDFTRSFEAFIDAVQQVNSGKATAADYEEELASVASTYRTTAILEAGRRSLDESRAITILYGDVFNPCRPTSLSSA